MRIKRTSFLFREHAFLDEQLNELVGGGLGWGQWRHPLLAGTVLVSGSLSKTLDTISHSASGGVLVSGATTKTLDGIGLSAAGAGTAGLSGSLAVTLDGITRAASGTVLVPGSLSKPLDSVSTEADGAVLVSGALDKPLEALQAASTGTVLVSGTLSKGLDGIALVGSGAAADGPIGSLTRRLTALALRPAALFQFWNRSSLAAGRRVRQGRPSRNLGISSRN